MRNRILKLTSTVLHRVFRITRNTIQQTIDIFSVSRKYKEKACSSQRMKEPFETDGPYKVDHGVDVSVDVFLDTLRGLPTEERDRIVSTINNQFPVTFEIASASPAVSNYYLWSAKAVTRVFLLLVIFAVLTSASLPILLITEKFSGINAAVVGGIGTLTIPPIRFLAELCRYKDDQLKKLLI